MSDIRCLVHSEAGDNHVNEDVVQVRLHPSQMELVLCSLADGQGGRFGGARAAKIAVRESLEAAASFSAEDLRQLAPWYPIIGAADDAVSEDDAAGFCTLICLGISKQEVFGASCGDSAVLLLSGGQEILLTENQRKNPPVGSGAAYPTAFKARLKPGWKLLVVSDGVWNCVGWEQVGLIAAQNQGDKLIAALRQAVLVANGGKLLDDFSFALFYDEQRQN